MRDSRERPTLAELRGRVHKDRHREVGNWLARRIGRPSAIYGTWLAVRLGLSAHQVTLAALLASITAAGAIATGQRGGFLAGVALAHLAFWLDHVDGQVARWRGSASLDGVYFDYLMHHAANLSLGFGLGYGLAARTGDLRWTLAGFAVAAGWTFLNLHNDCRYKAFFQRLKQPGRSSWIEGGSAARPGPPVPWPKRGRGLLTWPAYKSCEPHAVLLGLTGLALVGMISPTAWLVLWRAGVRIMAILAPALALGRAARGISRGTVETEFDLWFRPQGDQGERSEDSALPGEEGFRDRPAGRDRTVVMVFRRSRPGGVKDLSIDPEGGHTTTGGVELNCHS